MHIRNNMLHAGLSPLASREVCGNFKGALTGAGTTTADALALVAAVSHFSTVGSGSGAKLRPDLGSSESQTVFNNTATNALLVYPPTGGKVNNLSTDAGFSIPVNKSAIFFCLDNLNFIALLSA